MARDRDVCLARNQIPPCAPPDTRDADKNRARVQLNGLSAKELLQPGAFRRPDFLDLLYPFARREEPIVNPGQGRTDLGRHISRRDPGFAAGLGANSH